MSHEVADRLYDYRRREYRLELDKIGANKMNTDSRVFDKTRTFRIAFCIFAAIMSALILLGGCTNANTRFITTVTEHPNGEIVTVTAPAPAMDPDLAIVVTELTLRAEQALFDQWLRYESQDSGLDAAVLAAETARRTERINQLTAALQALYEARAQQ